MTSTHEHTPAPDGDDPAAVLARLRAARQAEEDAAREVMKAAADWAAMHSTASMVAPVDEWHERALPLGGQGCPQVAEFAVAELAASLGRSTDSGRIWLAKVIEGRDRLTHCWERMAAGRLAAWRIGFIAERTLVLSPHAAAYVDRHVAPVADRIGPAQLARLIEEAKARFDPEALEAERQAAADRRRVDLHLDKVTTDGTVYADLELDLADALDLEAAVAADAHQQLLAGSVETLDVRRSIALGRLARGQHALDLHGTAQRGRRSREVVLHVHLEHGAVLGAGGLARLHETPGPITAAQVRLWCGNPDAVVTVQPVIDLQDHLHTNAYQATSRLKLQTWLRDQTCIFPFCNRPAEHCDCDHRVPDEDDGPTCSCNIAPLCRRHHRTKTTGGWNYVTVEPGVYLWRSALGYQFLRDHTGTLDITPDIERQRLAREFRAHFTDPPAETEP